MMLEAIIDKYFDTLRVTDDSEMFRKSYKEYVDGTIGPLYFVIEKFYELKDAIFDDYIAQIIDENGHNKYNESTEEFLNRHNVKFYKY